MNRRLSPLTPFPPREDEGAKHARHLIYLLARTFRAPIGLSRDVADRIAAAPPTVFSVAHGWRPTRVVRSPPAHPNRGEDGVWVQLSDPESERHVRWDASTDARVRDAYVAGAVWAADLRPPAPLSPFDPWGEGCGPLEAYGRVALREGEPWIESGFGAWRVPTLFASMAGTVARLELWDGGYAPETRLVGAVAPFAKAVSLCLESPATPRFSLSAWLAAREGREVTVVAEPWTPESGLAQDSEEGSRWIGRSMKRELDAKYRAAV